MPRVVARGVWLRFGRFDEDEWRGDSTSSSLASRTQRPMQSSGIWAATRGISKRGCSVGLQLSQFSAATLSVGCFF